MANRISNPSRVYSGEYNQSKLQDFINKAIQSVFNQIPIRNSTTVSATITTSDTSVNHGLGRVPNGYLVIDRDAAQVVYTSTTSPASPSSQIILKAGGTVTATLLFF